MKKIKRIIAAAVLVSKDLNVLMGKVREGGVYPDCWHIPGGGVDGTETKVEALIREVQEEVGIDISNLSHTLLSDSDSGQAEKIDKTDGEKYLIEMEFNTYRVNLPNVSAKIAVSLNDDLREYKWVSIEDLKNYKLTPPSQKLFTSMGWLK